MTVVVLVILISAIIFSVGARWAVMKMRRAAYLGMKRGLPGARKSYRQGVWSVIRMGLGVVIALAIMIYWGVSGEVKDEPPAPATSPSVWIEIEPK